MVNYRDTVNLINEVEDLRGLDSAYNLSDIEMPLAFEIHVLDKITFERIDIDLNSVLEFKVYHFKT